MLREHRLSDNPTDHFQYLLFYAYALGLREVINELERIAALVKMLVGENTMVKPIFDRMDLLQVQVIN